MNWSSSRSRPAGKAKGAARRGVLLALTATAALLWGSAALQGQMMTEQFIPIGRSPGLSGKYSDIGVIEAVDPAAQRITLAGRSVAVTPRTHIWLDRSALRQTNVAGRFADLQPGRRAEVKYEDEARREAAAWIKVAPEPDG